MKIDSIDAKIKQLHWSSKRLVQVNLFGQHKSKIKGTGLEFDQLLDYQMGDDFRAIDWNSSARMNKLLIKQFHETKMQSIFVALDTSSSCFFSTDDVAKLRKAQEVAALLLYAAYLHNEQMGLLLFDETVHTIHHSCKGKAALQIMLQKIFSLSYKQSGTNISAVFKKMATIKQKNAILFIISDFIDDQFLKSVSAVNRSMDIYAIRILDRMEQTIPFKALLHCTDIETNQECTLSTGSINNFLMNRLNEQKKIFTRKRINIIDITPDKPLLDQLIYSLKHERR